MKTILTATGVRIGLLNWNPYEGYTIWLDFPCAIKQLCFAKWTDALRHLEQNLPNMPEHFRPLQAVYVMPVDNNKPMVRELDEFSVAARWVGSELVSFGLVPKDRS